MAAAAATLTPESEQINTINGKVALRPDGRFVVIDNYEICFYTSAGGGRTRNRVQFPGVLGDVSRGVYTDADNLLLAAAGTLDSTPDRKGVYALSLNAAGGQKAAPIRLFETLLEPTVVSLSMVSPDVAVVAWSTGAADFVVPNVRYIMIGRDGKPRTYGPMSIKRPSGRLGYTLMGVQGLSDGTAAIAFFRHDTSPERGTGFIQKIDRNGAPIGGHIAIGASDISGLGMCDAGGGLLAMAWVPAPSAPSGGGRLTMMARKLAPSGELGKIRLTETQIAKASHPPVIAMTPGGKFLAVLGGVNETLDQSAYRVAVRAFVLGDGLRYESFQDIYKFYDRQYVYYKGAAARDLVRLANGAFVTLWAMPPAKPKFQILRLT